jgi:uncharacterized protein YecT (DUF1311 family)
MNRLLLLSSLCLALPVAAQDAPIPACAAALAVPLPAGDQPGAAARARLQGCDSESLYYGPQRDDADARLCAYLERETGGLVFGGPAVLMMLYANGRGVARDFALARRFACELEAAPAELDGRLEHIAQMEADADAAELDLCDDITSGYMMGFCAEREAAARATGREQSWARLQASWSDADRAAWQVLRAAADDFFLARVEGEVDVSGTARGAFIVGERRQLEEDLLASVQAFERGELPRGDAAALQAADAQLNASYRAARAAAKPENPDDTYGPLGTVLPDAIRDVERAWLKYRDAWVVFGEQRYPSVPGDAWLDYFTRRREAQLRELVEGP